MRAADENQSTIGNFLGLLSPVVLRMWLEDLHSLELTTHVMFSSVTYCPLKVCRMVIDFYALALIEDLGLTLNLPSLFSVTLWGKGAE